MDIPEGQLVVAYEKLNDVFYQLDVVCKYLDTVEQQESNDDFTASSEKCLLDTVNFTLQEISSLTSKIKQYLSIRFPPELSEVLSQMDISK